MRPTTAAHTSTDMPPPDTSDLRASPLHSSLTPASGDQQPSGDPQFSADPQFSGDPQPTTPAAPADTPTTDTPTTRQAALTLLLRRGEATAAALAEELDVSVQVMRRHLRALEEEGLVMPSPAPTGPGRHHNARR